MLIAILALWRAAPDYYVTNVEQASEEGWKAMTVRIRDSDTDTAVKISAATSFQHFTDIFFRMNTNDPFYGMVEMWLKGALLV
jgi:neurofibromin 1